jgi:hypothetical protein
LCLQGSLARKNGLKTRCFCEVQCTTIAHFAENGGILECFWPFWALQSGTCAGQCTLWSSWWAARKWHETQNLPGPAKERSAVPLRLRVAGFGFSKIEPIAGSPSDSVCSGALLYVVLRVAGCHPGGRGIRAQADRPHWAVAIVLYIISCSLSRAKVGQRRKFF